METLGSPPCQPHHFYGGSGQGRAAPDWPDTARGAGSPSTSPALATTLEMNVAARFTGPCPAHASLLCSWQAPKPATGLGAVFLPPGRARCGVAPVFLTPGRGRAQQPPVMALGRHRQGPCVLDLAPRQSATVDPLVPGGWWMETRRHCFP